MKNERKAAPSAAEIQQARLAAAKDLKVLFGGKTAEGQVTKGVLHEHSLETIMAQEGWSEFIGGVQKNQHAKTLAVISCTHGDEKFPPALVAAIFSDEEQGHDPEWYANVFLAGHLEIFRSTGGKVGTMLHPMQVGIDMLRATENVFDHITKEQGNELGLSSPSESPRRQLATDLDSILEESASFGSTSNPDATPANKLYRWMLRKQRAAAAAMKAEVDENGGGKEDPAGALPGAGSNKKPDPVVDPRVAIEEQIARTDAAVKVAVAKGTPEGYAEAGTLASEMVGLRKQLEDLNIQPAPVAPANLNGSAAAAATPGPGASPQAPATDHKGAGDNKKKPPSKRKGLLERAAQLTGFASQTPATPPTAPPPAPPTAAAAPPPPPPPPAAPTASPAPPPTPAASASQAKSGKGNEDKELVMTAISGAGAAGVAMAALVNQGKRTLDQATAWAKERGIPGF